MCFYMHGLADNDIVGAAADMENAPERPIPHGEISLRTAKIARFLCLLTALLIGGVCRLPPLWWTVSACLVGTVVCYNRVKGLWWMGGCRGLNVLCGAAAVWTAGCPWTPAVGAVLCMAMAWTLYIAAVTKLSEGEERESEGLGNRRFLLGGAAWVPMMACAFFPSPRLLLLPALGCLWTFVTWCAAVAPLWRAHGPEVRRRAVGQSIGALLYLQIGFMLVYPHRVILGVVFLLWFAARAIRRVAPSISGS